jgi:hypothetical protein
MSDSMLHGLCETGSHELAAYLEAATTRHASSGIRWNVARSLWFEFEDLLGQADSICSEAEPEDAAASAPCRRTLDELKRVRLDLTALAVDPQGEERFTAALRRFDELWERWSLEVRTARPNA